MKKIIAAVAVLVTMNSFAADAPVTEKVLKAFNETFSYVKNVDWSEHKVEDVKMYEAYFKEGSTATRIRYDVDGNILYTIRSYKEEGLPILIQTKLKKAYPDKKVFGVTEVTNGESVVYEISLQDEKSWTIVRSDAGGYLTQHKKFKKG
jgi:hypothetical protein